MKYAPRRRDSLLLRLVIASLGPLVLAVVVQATYTMVTQRRAMVKGLEAKASSLAALMVNVAGPSIALDDPKAVEEALGYVEDDPDFGFSLALGPHGERMGYLSRAGEAPAVPRKAVLVSAPELEQQGDLMVMAVPVRTGSRLVGTIYLGLRMSGLKAQTNIMSLWATLISLAGVIIATFVVRALAGKIVERSRDMSQVLDNVDQAFLAITRTGVLQEERSAIATAWLGPYVPGQKFWEALATIDAPVAAWFHVGWEGVTDGFLPLEVVIDQLPKRAVFGDRTLRIEVKPLLAGEKLERALVVLSDITADLARERAEALERDLLRMLERMSRDRSGFLEFLEDASDLVQRIGARTVGKEDYPADVGFARDVHTLKGNSALFGLSTVASACQRIELALTDGDGPVVQARTRDLTVSWEDLQLKLKSLFGDHRDLPEIDPADLEELEGLLVRGSPANEVKALVSTWRLEPVALRLGRAVHQLRYLAWRMGKGEIDVKVESNRVRLQAAAWQSFWQAFVHVLRNTADHGIENAEQRRAAGKPEVPTVWLRAFKEADRFILEVEDDGRGIDWQKVGASARAVGLPASTQAELAEALFTDGTSTTVSPSEVSGRGVGLAAVREQCRRMGGDVGVASVAGRGTAFRFSWPQHVMTRAATLKSAA